MNITLSSGLKWRWMENYGLRFLLYGGVIRLFDGVPPSTPDLAPTGRRLATVTQDGVPFVPGDPGGGALRTVQAAIGIIRAAPAASNWKLTGEQAGRVTWFRFYANSADTDLDDPLGDYVRLDGRIQDSGGALILQNPVIVPAEVRPVDDFLLTFTI